MRTSSISPLTLALTLAPFPLRAQDGKPLDIDVTTSRVGPSAAARAAAAKSGGGGDDSDDRLVTEDTLPPKGNKKRLPGLHVIAKRYVNGKLWPEACSRYDQIVEEGGAEAMDLDPDAKKNAGRAYYQCAEKAFTASDFDKVEALLKKSESYGANDDRHKSLRRKMQKETYRKSMMNGDLDKAMAGFNAYQASGADEDERIWMGTQLAKACTEAYRNKDKIRLDRTMALAIKVAPKNAELRKLQDQIEGEEGVMGRMVLIGIAALAGLGVLTALTRWRAKAKIDALSGGGGLGGKKNKFLEDE